MKKWIAVLMTAVMLALTGSFAVMAEDHCIAPQKYTLFQYMLPAKKYNLTAGLLR